MLWGSVISSSEPQKNELTCGIKWLNFNSDLFVAKSHIPATISAVSKGRNGVWSVEAGAVKGSPFFKMSLSSAQRPAAWNPLTHGYCILCR